MTLTQQIIEACKTPKGLSRAEIAQQLGRPANNMINIADLLVKEGRLHKSGVMRAFRYFADKAHADAWAPLAKDAYAAQLQATRDARNEQRRTGKPPGRPSNMPATRMADMNHPPIPRSNAAPKPAPKPVKVIMPESVTVQVIPTPPSRFHFDPPKGWQGQITHDWMDRRLARSAG